MIRNAAVNPSAIYCDTPWDDPSDTGYAFQYFADNGDIGGFGELEYHSPAVGAGTGKLGMIDVSQLWAFEGSAHGIDTVMRTLLGYGLE